LEIQVIQIVKLIVPYNLPKCALFSFALFQFVVDITVHLYGLNFRT
jgi:hypothetical protein